MSNIQQQQEQQQQQQQQYQNSQQERLKEVENQYFRILQDKRPNTPWTYDEISKVHRRMNLRYQLVLEAELKLKRQFGQPDTRDMGQFAKEYQKQIVMFYAQFVQRQGVVQQQQQEQQLTMSQQQQQQQQQQQFQQQLQQALPPQQQVVVQPSSSLKQRQHRQQLQQQAIADRASYKRSRHPEDDDYSPSSDTRGKSSSSGKKNSSKKRKRKDMSGEATKYKGSDKRKRRKKNDATYEDLEESSDGEDHDIGADSNDLNYVFWKYVDDHFLPVIHNESRMQLLEPQKMTEDDIKIPDVGKLYRLRWQEEEEKENAENPPILPTVPISHGKRGRPSHEAIAKQRAKNEELQHAALAATRTPASSFFHDKDLPPHFIDVNESGDMLDSKSLSLRLLHSVVEERTVKLSRKKSRRFHHHRSHATPSTPIYEHTESNRVVDPQKELQVCNSDFESTTLKATDEKILHELCLLGIMHEKDFAGKIGEDAHDFFNRDDVLSRINELQDQLKEQIDVINEHRAVIREAVEDQREEEEALELQRKEDIAFFKAYEAKFGDPRKKAAKAT